MAQVFVFGRVTDDLTLKTSQAGSPYLCFNLAENISYGKKQRTLFYQVWAWDADALRLVRFGVKKRSLLWVTGSLELVDCTADNGTTKTKRLKVALDNWGFVPGGQKNQSETACTGSAEPEMNAASFSITEELDGDHSPLPE